MRKLSAVLLRNFHFKRETLQRTRRLLLRISRLSHDSQLLHAALQWSISQNSHSNRQTFALVLYTRRPRKHTKATGREYPCETAAEPEPRLYFRSHPQKSGQIMSEKFNSFCYAITFLTVTTSSRQKPRELRLT